MRAKILAPALGRKGGLLAVLVFALPPPTLVAQATGSALVESSLKDLDVLRERLISLAEAIPENSYQWAPGHWSEVANAEWDYWARPRSVSRLIMHIAHITYFHLKELGVPIPRGSYRGVPNLESLTDPKVVKETLSASQAHAQASLRRLHAESVFTSDEQLTKLLQLRTHLHEHYGQLIAYCRSLDIMPPWTKQEIQSLEQRPSQQ
jgi:hypothetical protein